jgi:gamma-glutamyltranspeptidase/glutathione hydrolase
MEMRTIKIPGATTPFSWQNPYAWPRKPLLAQNVVATSQPLAAQAGLQMLAEGGSAVDAILATAITLTLVEPVSNGIGSDAYAIVWDGRRLHGLNASGRSPQAWTPEYFKGGAMPVRGWNTVTVPGCVAAWVEMHAKWGKLPFKKLFERAIAYGRDGFLVSPTIAGQWEKQVAELKDQPGFAQAFLPGGRAPRPGERFRFPAHARTLERIAATKGKAFYRGEYAEKLEAHARKHGGAMLAVDLAANKPDWVKPLETDYRGYTLHEIPPNGQGIVALMALGMLEQFDVRAYPVDSADSLHVQIEAMKLAFADARRYVADIDAMREVRPEHLLDKAYLKARAKRIDMKRAQDFGHGRPPQSGTVYLTAADASGMMVSFIQSNYMGFGSGVVVDGISLQNRGATFVLEPDHPNRVAPRKRPYQTIIPGFVTRQGKPVMSFGVMGGTMQPQGHAQVLVRIADYDQSPQAACDGPRFRVVQGLDVSVEEGRFAPATLEELQRRGHRIVNVDDYNQFGSAQLVWKLEGGYFTASDPRRDGQAVGF